MSKQQTRQAFRDACFKRDGFACAVCRWTPKLSQWETYALTGQNTPLDAHHVTDRNLMPNGGYVARNGISLCDECHVLAEVYHTSGVANPGYSPNDLYRLIGSSYNMAIQDSFNLGPAAMPAEYWQRIDDIKHVEDRIATELGEAGPVTWELACGELGIQEPWLLTYGKGRYIECR